MVWKACKIDFLQGILLQNFEDLNDYFKNGVTFGQNTICGLTIQI